MRAIYHSTMLTLQKLRRKPNHFHNFTGLTPSNSMSCSWPWNLSTNKPKRRACSILTTHARGAGYYGYRRWPDFVKPIPPE